MPARLFTGTDTIPAYVYVGRNKRWTLVNFIIPLKITKHLLGHLKKYVSHGLKYMTSLTDAEIHNNDSLHSEVNEYRGLTFL